MTREWRNAPEAGRHLQDCGGVRILHVSDCFLPRLGGIEVQVDELARAQHAAGHDVAIATATPGASHDPRVHRIVAPLPWELPIGGSLRGLLRDLTPDVVHVHAGAVSPFAWRAVRRTLRAQVPTVMTVHSLWGPISELSYRVLFAGWRRDGFVVTTVSEAAAAPIRSVVRGRVPIEVVSNGIDSGSWRDASGAGRVAAGDVVHVVAVGRLAPRKEPLTLLKLLSAVRAGAPIRATVVGDGPARPAMERYARRHGMGGWLHLTGRLDRAEVRDVLAGADVFLAPAARESFGLAALEARLAGVPVVAQAGTGVADFVTSGREGLLGLGFTGLSAALFRLATDHDLRNTITAHNRATEPARCTWPAVLQAFDHCYTAAGVTQATRSRTE
jgi:phosphatidylinositol alpha 1,6-mannosyltransferase